MRKILLNFQEMGLLSKAFLDNLFPKPFEGELMTGSTIFLNGKDYMYFYFTDDYHTKLTTHIQKEYSAGRFMKSNAESNWISLMDDLNKYELILEIEEATTNYWLSQKKQLIEDINSQPDSVVNENAYDEMIDNEGNKYKTIRIGNQIWLAENFRATKYANGSDIKLIENANEWSECEDGAMCYLNNDQANRKYGAIYNWNVISRDICPSGWRIPTDDDWQELKQYLNQNGYNFDGSSNVFFGNKIAKSLASSHEWNESSKEGSVGNQLNKNNTSKFDAIPGGFRFGNGKFTDILKSSIFWWSSTEYNGLTKTVGGYYAQAPSLRFDDCSMAFNIYAKSFGFYIRLIKI